METTPGEELTEITLILDMQPAEYMPIRERFLAGLAGQLRCEPGDLLITSIRAGCTKVTVRMTSDRAVETLALANAPRPQADEFRVKEAFLNDLPEVLGADDLVPDAVFVTGDISQRANAAEYDKALDFLTRLKDRLPRPAAPIMVVPGNHDVQRDVVAQHQGEEDAAQKLLVSNDSIIDYLKSKKTQQDRERVFARLDNFFAFAARCAALGQPPMNHGYFYTTELAHKGLKIGVAGLNSAWRCSSDQDPGRLILGVPQIDQALQDLAASDLRLMLLHHPAESPWFVHEDQIYQRQQLANFDFILRGHEHDPHAVSLNQLHAAPSYRFAAGALYTHERFPKSVNAVRLNLDHGSARLFYWRLSPAKYEWVPDVDFHRAGSVQFPLTAHSKARLAARGLPPP